jgi:type IV pilus biogenesis protein CpaD/CtpE
MRFNYVLIVAVTLAGCASEPAKQVSDAPKAPTAAAPVSSAVSPQATQPVAKTESAAPASGEFRAPAGYQKKTKGKSTVYCRSDTPVGTRFATEYCYTQAELERIESSRSGIRQEVDRARRTCTGGGCGGG